jgi:hypothetical protein
LDPERKSFKQSLIAIAFAGVYLEALLSLAGRAHWGKDFYDEKIDRQFIYERKLRLLASSTKANWLAVHVVVHEKALYFEAPSPEKKTHKKKNRREDIRAAQKEGIFGVQFVKSMASKLPPALLP